MYIKTTTNPIKLIGNVLIVEHRLPNMDLEEALEFAEELLSHHEFEGHFELSKDIERLITYLNGIKNSNNQQ